MKLTSVNAFAFALGTLIFLATFGTACRVDGQDPFAAPDGAANVFGQPEGGGIFGDVPPGGDPNFIDGARPAAADANEVINTNPLIDELRRYSGGTLKQQATAIRSAVQISDWPEAVKYLDLLGKRELTDAQRRSVVSIIRPQYLLRLQQHPSLNDEQRAWISDLIAGAKKYAEDRQRLRSQIAALESPNASLRADAIGVLRAGGLPAIAELAAAYVNPQSPAERGVVFDVLRRFDPDAFDAMRQLALYAKTPLRAAALEALIRLDRDRALPDMVVGYIDPEASPEQRQVAMAGLKQVLAGMPSEGEAEIYLGRQLDHAIALARRSRVDAPSKRVWEVQADESSLAWSDVPERLALFRGAADAAAGVMRLPQASPELAARALVADIGYRVMLADQYGTAEDYASRYGPSGASDAQRRTLRESLLQAIQDENVPAAVGVIRMLAHTDDDALVGSNGANRKLLVATAMDPIPQIRYEAAIAVARLDYDRAYVGSSDILHRWIEMSELQRQPVALFLESRQAARRYPLQWLEALGYRVIIVPTVAELVQCVESGGDIQLIVATSEPVDRQIVETVDLIRRRSLGRMIPMLIYCQNPQTIWDDDSQDPILNSGGVVIVDVASDTQAKPLVADPYRRGPPRKPKTAIKRDQSLERKMHDLRARTKVREQQLRISAAIGQRWAAPLAVVPQIDAPTTLAEHINALMVQLPAPPLDGLMRERYSRQGLAILMSVATSDNGEHVYDFRSHEQELTKAVQTGGFSKQGLTLLSSLGTSGSQDLLANLVASVALSDAARQNAAEAFAESVKRYGTRISREAVALQYQRYNATATPEARAVMGVVLDAMEQRVHATSKQP